MKLNVTRGILRIWIVFGSIFTLFMTVIAFADIGVGGILVFFGCVIFTYIVFFVLRWVLEGFKEDNNDESDR